MRSGAPPAARLADTAVVKLVGDLHLGDGGRNDAFGAKDELLVRFLAACPDGCDAVVFMGDAFDLPQALGARRIARAHPAVLFAIDALSRRLPVFFVRGNHDWTVDYARLFPRATACERLAVGDTLVWHGHQLDPFCRPDRRFHRTQVTLHHLAERLFGFEFRVPLAEHDSWQNRAAHWLGHHYGRHLRRAARRHRRRGRDRAAAACEEFIRYWSRAVWGDPHALFAPAVAALRHGPWRAMVCGHTHLAGVVDLGDRTYVNAGSWTYASGGVVTRDAGGFSAEDRVTRAAVSDERYRWMIDGTDPGDFFAWWARHYRGWLRFAP